MWDEPRLDALKHALQCAAILERTHPDDPELIAAGLVHDVSDNVYPDHDDHDGRGAALVAPLLGARVAKLVGAHVVAKRYLVTADAAYRATLSPRSVETLLEQGDVLDQTERAALEADVDLDAMLELRRADEGAKDPHAVVPDLASWRPLLERLAQ